MEKAKRMAVATEVSTAIVGPEYYSDKSIAALETRSTDPALSPQDRDIILAQIRDAREAKHRMEQDAINQANAPKQQVTITNPAYQAGNVAPFSPSVGTQPAAPGVGIISAGATSMFNSPENLQRIADLMSKADSGQPIDEVMEEIRKATGLDRDAFWSSISSIGKSSSENPFASDDDGEKGDEKEESKVDDKANPFAKKEDNDEDKGEDEGEDSDDKSESPKKEEKKEEKKDKKEDEEEIETPEWEKRDIKMAKKALELLEKLMKREKKEGEMPQAEELKQAIDFIEKFLAAEKGEVSKGSEDMAVIEKTGPDVPPAMEGLALPLPEPMKEDEEGMKVIDLAPPVLPLIAAHATGEPHTHAIPDKKADAVIETMKGAPHIGDVASVVEKGVPAKPQPRYELQNKPPVKKAAQNDPPTGNEPDAIPADQMPESTSNVLSKSDGDESPKESSFKLHDRVWRKSDFESGFETVGDEPGRIVDFGNGKAIVDWGNDIPTEENMNELVLVSSASGEDLMFAPEKTSAEPELEPVHANRGPMSGASEVELVLRETSLYDILAKQAKDNEVIPDTVKHIASGKTGKILHRLAGGQLRVSVDGKELVLWPYEVE